MSSTIEDMKAKAVYAFKCCFGSCLGWDEPEVHEENLQLLDDVLVTNNESATDLSSSSGINPDATPITSVSSSATGQGQPDQRLAAGESSRRRLRTAGEGPGSLRHPICLMTVSDSV